MKNRDDLAIRRAARLTRRLGYEAAALRLRLAIDPGAADALAKIEATALRVLAALEVVTDETGEAKR